MLRLSSEGKRTATIAEELGIAESTVKNHFHSIYGKLGVGSRLEAVLACMRLGLLQLDSAPAPRTQVVPPTF